MDERLRALAVDDRIVNLGKVELALLIDILDEHTRKLRRDWEEERKGLKNCGPYYYAATLTVQSALPLEKQKTKLLKMLHTLLRGKSIGSKYQIDTEDSYYVWELTKAGTLHIHLSVKSALPAKHYDIRKVSGMEGANWQEMKSRESWLNYLVKNLDDPLHIETKAKLALVDKLPNGLEKENA